MASRFFSNDNDFGNDTWTFREVKDVFYALIQTEFEFELGGETDTFLGHAAAGRMGLDNKDAKYNRELLAGAINEAMDATGAMAWLEEIIGGYSDKAPNHIAEGFFDKFAPAVKNAIVIPQFGPAS